MTREKEILALVPKDVETVFDIGGYNNIFSEYESVTLDYQNANIIQDLNKSQKIPVKDESFDLVVLSQILEHLATCDQLIVESKRIAKKYILVGLPNELTIDNRLKFLMGRGFGWRGYNPYGHKHFFTIQDIEKFINKFFGSYNRKYYLFGVKGGRFIPLFLRKFLAKTLPTLFAKEVYYLINIQNEK